MIFRLILILSLFFSVGGLMSFEGKKDCAADVKKLCADKKKGERRKCLIEKKAEASPECQASIDKALEARAKKYPCAQDRDTFCKDVKKGDGRIYNCLVEKMDQLTPACSAKLKAKIEKQEARKEAKKNKKSKPPISDAELTD
jgi:hypothetical protein